MLMYETNTLHTLNLHNVIHQLYHNLDKIVLVNEWITLWATPEKKNYSLIIA